MAVFFSCGMTLQSTYPNKRSTNRQMKSPDLLKCLPIKPQLVGWLIVRSFFILFSVEIGWL